MENEDYNIIDIENFELKMIIKNWHDTPQFVKGHDKYNYFPFNDY